MGPLVLIGKDLVLEGSRLKIEDKQVPGIYIYIFFVFNCSLLQISGQISIIPKPELRGFWGSSLIKPPFRVTSAGWSL